MLSTRTFLLASVLVSLFTASAARAQAPGWQAVTAIATTTPGASEIRYTATDASGNVVVAGEFVGAITLGSFTLSSPTVRIPFVAKWNTAAGTWAWAQQLSCSEITYLGGLALSGSSIYLSGGFKGTAAAGTISLSSPNNYNTFVAKLTDTGTSVTWVWAQQAGGTNDEYGNGLAVQGTSVYVTGLTYSSVISFGNFSVSSANSSTSFVAKLTDSGSQGTYNWAVVPTGLGFGWLKMLSVQGTTIYAAGRISGTQTFGSTTLPGYFYGDNDVLVAKLADAGTSASWVWAQRAGGPNDDEAVALATSGPNVYVTGDYTSTSMPFGTTTLTNPGGNDVFVAKLTDAGTTAGWTWAQRIGGAYSEESRGIAVRGSSIYLSGQIASFPSTFGTISLTPTSNGAAYLARLVDAGPSASFAWAQAVGSTFYSTASGLSSSGNQVYLAGSAGGNAAFGNQTTTGTSNTQYAFLAAVTDAVALPTLAPVALAEGLALFPNPAHHATTVQLPAGLAAGAATLTVLDATGRAVRSRTATLPAGTSQTTLDVAGLAPGVYTLRVAVAESLHTTRLVVE